MDNAQIIMEYFYAVALATFMAIFIVRIAKEIIEREKTKRSKEREFGWRREKAKHEENMKAFFCKLNSKTLLEDKMGVYFVFIRADQDGVYVRRFINECTLHTDEMVITWEDVIERGLARSKRPYRFS